MEGAEGHRVAPALLEDYGCWPSTPVQVFKHATRGAIGAAGSALPCATAQCAKGLARLPLALQSSRPDRATRLEKIENSLAEVPAGTVATNACNSSLARSRTAYCGPPGLPGAVRGLVEEAAPQAGRPLTGRGHPRVSVLTQAYIEVGPTSGATASSSAPARIEACSKCPQALAR